MFQLRGLSDDPWAEAGSGEVVDMNPTGPTIGDRIMSFFNSAPTVAVQTTQPTPTTKTTTVTVAAKPWYKTPFGIAAIAGGLFVGWKYVLPKLRKPKA